MRAHRSHTRNALRTCTDLYWSDDTGPPTGESHKDSLGRTFIVRTESLDLHQYEVPDDPGNDPAEGSFVVEPGRYFVRGDNRLNSNDSQYWGTIRREEIIGEVSKIYWSWSFNGSAALLLNPLEWPDLLQSQTRWDRIGLAPN